MRNNLKLITTEMFGDLPCNFYRNMNDDILITREQIGTALEYTDPSKAIRKIHLKHRDRLESLCVRLKIDMVPQFGANLSKSEEQERVYYTGRGVMEICRWSRQPKANIFMDWVWDVIEAYRQNDMTSPSIANSFNALAKSVTDTLLLFDKRLLRLEENQTVVPQSPPKKRFSYWASKMLPKYQLLMDYFNIETHKELYSQLFKEFQNTYPDVELNQLIDDYCYENKVYSCFTLESIEHNKTIRMAFESMVDDLLRRYNLLTERTIVKEKTIFD